MMEIPAWSKKLCKSLCRRRIFSNSVLKLPSKSPTVCGRLLRKRFVDSHGADTKMARALDVRESPFTQKTTAFEPSLLFLRCG